MEYWVKFEILIIPSYHYSIIPLFRKHGGNNAEKFNPLVMVNLFGIFMIKKFKYYGCRPIKCMDTFDFIRDKSLRS
jgi:hypothetical protein